MTFEQILDQAKAGKLESYAADAKIKVLVNALPEGRAIIISKATFVAEVEALGESHSKLTEAYANHIGRNRLDLQEIHKELFDEDQAYVDNKAEELNKKISDSYTKLADAKIEKHKLQSAAESKKDPKFSETQIRYLEQVRKLVTRLEEGRYRKDGNGKKGMIMKIFKMYSRASDSTWTSSMVNTIYGCYGQSLFLELKINYGSK